MYSSGSVLLLVVAERTDPPRQTTARCPGRLRACLACRWLGASRIFSKSRGLRLTRGLQGKVPPAPMDLVASGEVPAGSPWTLARRPGGLAACLALPTCWSPRETQRVGKCIISLELYARVPSLKGIRPVLAKLCPVEITPSGLWTTLDPTLPTRWSPRETQRVGKCISMELCACVPSFIKLA